MIDCTGRNKSNAERSDGKLYNFTYKRIIFRLAIYLYSRPLLQLYIYFKYYSLLFYETIRIIHYTLK